jgi:hypothetical protein
VLLLVKCIAAARQWLRIFIEAVLRSAFVTSPATTNADSFHIIGRADGRIVTSPALLNRRFGKTEFETLLRNGPDIRLVTARLALGRLVMDNLITRVAAAWLVSHL